MQNEGYKRNFAFFSPDKNPRVSLVTLILHLRDEKTINIEQLGPSADHEHGQNIGWKRREHLKVNMSQNTYKPTPYSHEQCTMLFLRR
jgi:hypothetical protein